MIRSAPYRAPSPGVAYQALGDGRHDTIWQEFTWARAIHRTDTDGISSEQAVDDAIA